jgi:hypothetical protein
MDFRLNKHIVKYELDDNIQHNLRDWFLLRRYAAGRSGLFTLDQLEDIYTTLEINSLSDRSNRAKWKRKKAVQLRGSKLFTHVKGDTYKFTSLKRSLVDYKGSAKHTDYDIPESYLKSPGAFLDACIGVLMVNGGYSNAGAARLFKVTPRRIQKATAANDKADLFKKHFNKINESYPTHEEALKQYKELKAHGIGLPEPIKINNDWCITLNAVNSYKSHTLKRYKGRIDRKRSICSTPGDRHIEERKGRRYTPESGGKVWEKWFLPMYRGKGSRSLRERTESAINGRALVFNNSVYHIGNFILDHSNAV